MLNIPREYKIDVDESPYKVKFRKDEKTHYKIKCSYCGKYVVFAHGEANTIDQCPHCNVASPWILKPKTERILFELQEEYLSKIDNKTFEAYYKEMRKPEHERNSEVIKAHHDQMDKETLTKMFFIIKDYSNSLLKKRIKTKGFYLPNEQFVDKVEQIAFLWYQQFTEKPGFKINDSWAGQLNWKITEALYASSEDDRHDSFDRVIESYKGEKDQNLGDLAETFNIKFLFTKKENEIEDPYEETIDILQELKKLTKLIIKSIRRGDNKSSYRESFLSLYSLLFFLQGDTKREDYIYSTFGNPIRENGDKIKLILRKYLREIHDQNA